MWRLHRGLYLLFIRIFLMLLTSIPFNLFNLAYGSPFLLVPPNNTTNDMLPYQIACSDEDQCNSFPIGRYSFVLDSKSLFDELQACNWNRFVMIMSLDISKTVREYVRHLLAPRKATSTLYYEVTNTNWQPKAIQEIIWKAYNQQRIKNFIWVTKKHNEVMEAAQRVFEQRHCGNGALMTTRSNFLFVTADQDILSDNYQMKNSLFDNVAFFVVNENSPFLEKAYTLMWRENRLRDFQEITNLVNNSADNLCNICNIFPNIINGLNGRTIVGMAKEWLPEFYKVTNDVTGELEFSGFYIDVFDILASTLNFSYKLVPPAGEDGNITWDQYAEIVSECKVDFGINLFSNNAIFHYNVTTSFPVLDSNYIGAYINEEKPNPYKLFLIFKKETYLVIFSSLFFTVFFYLLLVYLLCPSDTTLDCPAGDKEKVRIVNQQQMARQSRSSCFEVDWQNKYSRLDATNIFSNSNISQIGRVNLNNRKSNQAIGISYTERIKNNGVCYIKKHVKYIHSCSIKYNKNNINIFNKRRNLAKKHTIVTKVRPREHLYNNSSHYETDFVKKIFETEHEGGKETNIGSVRSTQTKIEMREEAEVFVYSPIMQQSNGLNDVDTRSMSRFEYFVEIWFSFCGSLFNQGTLPHPRCGTHRLLLSSWSFMTIVLIATYTGNLTSTFADNTEVVPITSFEDLVTKDDFRWGALSETLVYSLLKSSTKGSTFHKLYEGIERFKSTDPTILGDWNDLITNIKAGKFVAFITSFVFEYLEDYTDLPGLTLIPDQLLTANGGFLFPNNSELNLLISRQIIAMRDSGILNNIFHRLRLANDTTEKVYEDTSNLYLNMDNVVGLFIVITFVVVIAIVVLIIEMLIPKLRSEREH